jgi:hypothetical protein
MKRCSVCNLPNFDHAPRCTSCSTPFPLKKKGYFYIIRWHLLALLLVLGMMGMLKFRGGNIFRDFNLLAAISAAGDRVEISGVRIYHDLTGKTVIEGNLGNLSGKEYTGLSLEVTAYSGQDGKLGRHRHPIPALPQTGKVPFLIKIPLYKDIHHAHFTLRAEDGQELYLINRSGG